MSPAAASQGTGSDPSGSGPDRLGDAARRVDVELCGIAEAFDWLELVTPIDLAQTWREFERGGFQDAPRFRYPAIELDLGALRRRLLELPLLEIQDPVVAALLAEKQREVDRQLSLLDLRGTSGFLQVSLDLFGEADESLVQLAGEVVDLLAAAPTVAAEEPVGANEVLARARVELQEYARRVPDFPQGVELCDGLASGMRVSHGVLQIARDLTMREARLAALLHHEIGTHVLTFFNGSRQPLLQFRDGLAHYETLQEGLGVLAEHLAGGLSPGRMRILAARVLAVADLVDGHGFVDVFERLRSRCALAPRLAFSVTLRVFRGGGLTKDALYLRGLRDVLAWLHKGLEVEPLFVGKIGLLHLEAVVTMREQDLLVEPAVLPRYLWNEDGEQRLAHCRSLDVLGLVREMAAAT
ncbi:MAG TPA: tyrosine/phenylalanine carboxypeptidase domain-containing protein [Thermoanaerobaculia bacterium]|nr:tyrosine/phenylalanine carboxypeptidase domain-containing protein [Thermoanaerobaculia bacterium]